MLMNVEVERDAKSKILSYLTDIAIHFSQIKVTEYQ